LPKSSCTNKKGNVLSFMNKNTIDRINMHMVQSFYSSEEVER